MIKQLFTAALAAIALSAHAAEPNPFYAGIDLGATKMERWSSNNESSYGVFAGYKVNQTFAIEAGWRRLYDAKAFGWARGDQSSLSLIGSAPLAGNLSVYGRLGVSYIRDQHTYQDGSGYHSDMTRALYGAGLSYKLNEKVSARLEVQRPGDNLTNLSTGISYSF